MDVGEQLIATRAVKAGITVGLFDDYGPAQRLYAKRGYLPDGRGAPQRWPLTLCHLTLCHLTLCHLTPRIDGRRVRGQAGMCGEVRRAAPAVARQGKVPRMSHGLLRSLRTVW